MLLPSYACFVHKALTLSGGAGAGDRRARARRAAPQRRNHLPPTGRRKGRADLAPYRLQHDPPDAIVSLLSQANRRKRNLLIIAGFLLLVGAANLVDKGVYAPDLPPASNTTVFALL